MSATIVITRPDVIALIEAAAGKVANGDKTEAVALALRAWLARDDGEKSRGLFGAHAGSVIVAPGVDLTAPVFDGETDAETGRELEH